MFIISKKNFKVRRADGSSYLIAKDYIGEIPDDVYYSTLIQNAVKGGSVAAPKSTKDKNLNEASEEAEKKAEETDIRPDAQNNKDDSDKHEPENKSDHDKGKPKK